MKLVKVGHIKGKQSKLKTFTICIEMIIVCAILASLAGLLPNVDKEIIARAIAITTVGIVPVITAGSLSFLLVVFPAVTFYPFVNMAAKFGIWLRFIGIRMVASLHHPLHGVYAMPHNCYRILLTVNYRLPLDLPPTLVDPTYSTSSLDILYKDSATDQLDLTLSPLQLKIVTLIAILYRFSLKTICWPYFPFLWIIQKKLQKSSP